MPSFKSLSSKMLGGIKKRNESNGDNESRRSTGSDSAVDLQGDGPEATAARSVKAFCESGGPGNSGDEVTFLPSIVESAESSPAAAAECARLIRRFLKKDYWSRPTYQYNALMLMRILSDNPGQTFTRNLDAKFAETLKEVLRNGKDLSVRSLLMETLDSFEQQKGWDEGLVFVLEMWKKEKEKAYKAYGGRAPPPPMPPQMTTGQPYSQDSQNYFARAHTSNRLPAPAELANRLEEARTSAKLLQQLVDNTPSTEVLDNDLVKEFADRCLSASRSIQGYMTAENPGPDNETMETLIDVNEELQRALNSQKRAALSARKELGIGDRSQNPSPSPQPETNGQGKPPPPPTSAPGGAYPAAGGAYPATGGAYPSAAPAIPRKPPPGKGKERQDFGQLDQVAPPPGPPPRRSTYGPVSPISADDGYDPFRDPEPVAPSATSRGKAPARPPVSEQPNLDSEGPFHPGFSHPTQSYLGRQDSAMNKIHMHGAGTGSYDDEDTAKEVVDSRFPARGGSGSSGRQRTYTNDSEDIYGTTPDLLKTLRYQNLPLGANERKNALQVVEAGRLVLEDDFAQYLDENKHDYDA